MNKKILPPMVIAALLVAYRGIANGSAKNNPIPNFPLPSQFLGVFVVFGTLSFFTGGAADVAALVAYGLDVAILLNFWNPDGTVKKTNLTQSTQTPAVKTKG